MKRVCLDNHILIRGVRGVSTPGQEQEIERARQEFLGFSLRPLARYGFLSMMHESRNDICMLLGSAYLLVVGAGRLSLDARIAERKP